MPRVKRGPRATQRRRSLLVHTKGFKWRRKTHYRLAKDALLHAWTRAFHDRKKKKGDFRALWNIKINAASRAHGISYSRFIASLKKNNIELDRKILAALAENEPKVFEKIIEKVK
jgi:large subunit ribosomal protein L20